jgi:hypothetical protein
VPQLVPEKIATSRSPVAAVAAQKTLPVPSLVQLGADTTDPASEVQLPHFVSLYSLTIICAFALSTAQTTCSVDTWAQEGLPIPVVLPVEVKAPQLACDGDVKNRAAAKTQRQARTVRLQREG